MIMCKLLQVNWFSWLLLLLKICCCFFFFFYEAAKYDRKKQGYILTKQTRGRLIIASIIKRRFTGLKWNTALHKASPSGYKPRHLVVRTAPAFTAEVLWGWLRTGREGAAGAEWTFNQLWTRRRRRGNINKYVLTAAEMAPRLLYFSLSRGKPC